MALPHTLYRADLDTTRGMEFVAEKIAAKIGTGLEFNPTTGEIQTTLSGTTFKGTVDLTTENTNLQGDTNNPDVNASPIVGDLYANIGGDSDGNGIFSTAGERLQSTATEQSPLYTLVTSLSGTEQIGIT